MNADEIVEMTDYVRGHITNRMTGVVRFDGTTTTEEEAEAEFDDWLASVKAEAWDECLESLRPELEHELLYVKTVNPYREVTE